MNRRLRNILIGMGSVLDIWPAPYRGLRTDRGELRRTMRLYARYLRGDLDYNRLRKYQEAVRRRCGP